MEKKVGVPTTGERTPLPSRKLTPDEIADSLGKLARRGKLASIDPRVAKNLRKLGNSRVNALLDVPQRSKLSSSKMTVTSKVAVPKQAPAREKKGPKLTSESKQSPAVVNAVLAAAMRMFPSKLLGRVPPVSVGSTTMAYKTPRGSQLKISLPLILSTEATPMYYGFIAVLNYWSGKVYVGATLTAGTNTFATTTQTNDPLYSSVGANALQVSNGGMCMHILNATSMQTSGGELIAGNIPATIATSPVSWNTLLAYNNTQYATMTGNPEFCYPWMPTEQDLQPFNYNSYFGGVVSQSALFMAVRSSTAQTIEMCIDSCYGIEPVASATVLLGGQVWPADVSAYERTLEKLAPADGVPKLVTPAEEDSSFLATVKSIGKTIGDAVVPGLGGLVEKGISWIGGLFGDTRLENFLRMLETNGPAIHSAALANSKKFPPDFLDLLVRLSAYRLQFTNTAFRIERDDGSDFVFRRGNSIVDEFGNPTFQPDSVSDSRESRDFVHVPTTVTPVTHPR